MSDHVLQIDDRPEWKLRARRSVEQFDAPCLQSWRNARKFFALQRPNIRIPAVRLVVVTSALLALGFDPQIVGPAVESQSHDPLNAEMAENVNRAPRRCVSQPCFGWIVGQARQVIRRLRSS